MRDDDVSHYTNSDGLVEEQSECGMMELQENFSSPNPRMPNATHSSANRAPHAMPKVSQTQNKIAFDHTNIVFLNSRKFQIVSQYPIKPSGIASSRSLPSVSVERARNVMRASSGHSGAFMQAVRE